MRTPGTPLTATVLAFVITAGVAAQKPAAKDTLLVSVNRAEEQAAIFKVTGTRLDLVKRLPVGKTAREVCISPNGTRAYVSNQESDSVTVLDLESLAVAGTISGPQLKAPDGCIVSANSRILYVTSSGNNSVVQIATADNSITRSIATGLGVPRRLVFSMDAQKLYVGHNAGWQFNYIDLPTWKMSDPVVVGGEARGGLALTPDGRTFFIGNVEDDTVSWVDTFTHRVVRTVGVPISPQRIIVRPDGTAAYVLTRMGIGSAGVFVMPITDKHDSSKFIPTAAAPWGLAMTPDASLLFVSSNTENVIQVIDTKALKVVGSVPAGRDPNGLALRP